MPILFRCEHCRKKLSIAKRKVGAPIECPGCAATITVPTPEKFSEEITELLEMAGATSAQKKGELAPAKPRPRLRPKTTNPKAAANPDDRPLFEGDDFNVLLAPSDEAKWDAAPIPLPPDPQPPQPSKDTIVLPRSTAILLGIAMLILLGLAFAAGFLVGGKAG